MIYLHKKKNSSYIRVISFHINGSTVAAYIAYYYVAIVILLRLKLLFWAYRYIARNPTRRVTSRVRTESPTLTLTRQVGQKGSKSRLDSDSANTESQDFILTYKIELKEIKLFHFR